jgi:hypothetical protein
VSRGWSVLPPKRPQDAASPLDHQPSRRRPKSFTRPRLCCCAWPKPSGGCSF